MDSRGAIVSLTAAASAAGAYYSCRAAPGAPVSPQAVCCLVGSAGVSGTIHFFSEASGGTRLKGVVSGLAPGKHGFHIHQLGDTTNGCLSTGPHFNPGGKSHGAPNDSERHAGDLGNITAGENGVANIEITDFQIPLGGPNSIVGRAVVCHELADDLGRGDSSEVGKQGKTSKTTGNAGARLACGVIGRCAPR